MTIVLAGVGVSLLIIRSHRKWKCTETGCELVLGGDHASHPECKKACDKVQKEAEEADDEASSGEEENGHSYMCAANGQCVPVKGSHTAPFTSMEHCTNNCAVPSTVVVNPYYPQSMFPRPWGRHWSRRRHRQSRRKSRIR